MDDQALIPITVAQQQLYGARTPDGNGWKVSSIQISVTNSADITSVHSRIQTLLRQRHSRPPMAPKTTFRCRTRHRCSVRSRR